MHVEPLLIVGYRRTLEPKDLWKLTPELESGYLNEKLMSNFNRRISNVKAHNASIKDGSYKPSLYRRNVWKVQSKVFGYGRADGIRNTGFCLAGAISDTFFYQFWGGGAIKVIGDMAQILSPLVTKALINFSTESYYAHRGYPGFTSPNVGTGIAMAIGLWLMVS